MYSLEADFPRDPSLQNFFKKNSQQAILLQHADLWFLVHGIKILTNSRVKDKPLPDFSPHPYSQ